MHINLQFQKHKI